MTLLPFILFDNHVIMELGNDVILLDTGAPQTVNSVGQFEFLGKIYHPTSNYVGVTVEGISRMLGKNITVLLGADILSKYTLTFDYSIQEISFSEKEYEFHGTSFPIDLFMNIPIVNLSVNGQQLKMFLDTGAKLSYIHSSILEGCPIESVEQDFYPGLGQFETNCYSIQARIGDIDFPVKFGCLPPLLQATLLMAGTNGIIGSDFFHAFKVNLDYRNKVIKIAGGREIK